ncbi:GPP34 family phosphoprotein [Streptomyces sp. WAC08241]|uniref:GOLPH3/VPS74 family protein n=1 Tax=Streptomyces sp. WAC08241 TaxID=2487421 RepID=UPI000F76BD82|nr:GPP34 family phosphoprotein [Streptomyces sp. WAC08241]RSS34087.1 GPP34 family phosphoprotein [Streptomyces sp. WAC08241]
MTVTLAEEIVLLSLDDESGAAKEKQSAAWAVAGGILLDLVLAGRVTVDGGRLRVADETPTGVPLLDERLRRIAEWAGRRSGTPKVTEWLTKDCRKAARAATDSLRGRGLVRAERRRVLGIFPVTRYPEADGSVERELRDRLRAVVLGGAAPDPRTAGLVALVHGAKLHRLAFPDVPRKEVAPRLAEIAAGQWVAEDVRRAIHDMQAAMVVVMAATVVTVAS